MKIFISAGLIVLSALFLFTCLPEPDGTNENVTVTFDADNESENTEITIVKGTSLGEKMPVDPSKPNFKFGGWWYDNKRYYSFTIIDEDDNFTLTAKWITAGTPVTEWMGLSVPTGANGTSGTLYSTYSGKTNVLHVKPANNSDYSWAVLSKSLSGFSGKTVTIDLSVYVLIDTQAKIAWQANLGSTYPVIAGSNQTAQTQINEWIEMKGKNDNVVIPANGGTLYISGGGNGGQLQNLPIDIFLANFTVKITDNSVPEDSVYITLGGTRDLKNDLPQDVTASSWSSSAPSIVSVNSSGIATAVSVSNTSSSFNTGGTALNPASNPATGLATITATLSGGGTYTIPVLATTQGTENILSLSPMKDHFASNFKIGNIYRGTSAEISGTGAGAVFADTRLTRHFNAITAENNMKPSYLISARNSSTGDFTWNASNRTTANNFVNAAKNANMDVIGHTLLWHSQNPDWVWSQIASKTGTIASGMDKNKALEIMRSYITTVVTEFKGKVHTWDVLNEVFPDNASGTDWKNSMRKAGNGEEQDANPWYIAIGSDFVYEGFLAARLADPDAKLYYNDYNTETTNRRNLIHAMVQEVNALYLTKGDKPVGEASNRLLIEGIGMQEHHNLGVSAGSIEGSITKFKELGVELAVSELDILAYNSYGDYTSGIRGNGGNTGTNYNHLSTVTNQQLITLAGKYNEYMKLYIKHKDVIKRVSLWGITDDTSWRSGGLPLLFDHAGNAKPAYYSFIKSLTN